MSSKICSSSDQGRSSTEVPQLQQIGNKKDGEQQHEGVDIMEEDDRAEEHPVENAMKNDIEDAALNNDNNEAGQPYSGTFYLHPQAKWRLQKVVCGENGRTLDFHCLRFMENNLRLTLAHPSAYGSFLHKQHMGTCHPRAYLQHVDMSNINTQNQQQQMLRK